MSTFDKTALVLVIIGALNWLLIGVAKYDLVGAICGGTYSIVSRTIFTIVGLAGIWMISTYFRTHVESR
jgi:uncharacterized membrane protein YuzA (DUF378 family)